ARVTGPPARRGRTRLPSRTRRAFARLRRTSPHVRRRPAPTRSRAGCPGPTGHRVGRATSLRAYPPLPPSSVTVPVGVEPRRDRRGVLPFRDEVLQRIGGRRGGVRRLLVEFAKSHHRD